MQRRGKGGDKMRPRSKKRRPKNLEVFEKKKSWTFIIAFGLIIAIVFSAMGCIPLTSKPMSITTYDSPDIYLTKVTRDGKVLWEGEDVSFYKDASWQDPALSVEVSQPNFKERSTYKTELVELIDYRYLTTLVIGTSADNIFEGQQRLHDYEIYFAIDYKGRGKFKYMEIEDYRHSENVIISPSAKGTEIKVSNNYTEYKFTIGSMKANQSAEIFLKLVVRYQKDLDPLKSEDHEWDWIQEYWASHGFLYGTSKWLHEMYDMSQQWTNLLVFAVFFFLIFFLVVLVLNMALGRSSRPAVQAMHGVGSVAGEGVGATYRGAKIVKKDTGGLFSRFKRSKAPKTPPEGQVKVQPLKKKGEKKPPSYP